MIPVVMTWDVGNTYGWGILGLNIFFQWANDPEITPLSVTPITRNNLSMVDPIRFACVNNALVRSNEFAEKIASGPKDSNVTLNTLVIHAIGNGFTPTRFQGSKNIGRIIFEDTRFDDFAFKIEPYDVLLVASNWAKEMISSRTDKPVHMIHEGIDPSLFFPGPKSGMLDPDRFYIFSGGKIEYRKAQDLTLAAFRIFAKNHPDAVLVTAWHSPWPQFSEGFKGILATPLKLSADGRINGSQWAFDNGIAPGQFFDIGPITNQLMPNVLREMDVCLLPSRAEACSNLPAMEAMACGVPVILSDNTGHKDLIESFAGLNSYCLPLKDQRTVDGFLDWGTDGWGESNIDEIVACLEYVYQNRSVGKEIGKMGSNWIRDHKRTWSEHAACLKSLVMSL